MTKLIFDDSFVFPLPIFARKVRLGINDPYWDHHHFLSSLRCTWLNFESNVEPKFFNIQFPLVFGRNHKLAQSFLTLHHWRYKNTIYSMLEGFALCQTRKVRDASILKYSAISWASCAFRINICGVFVLVVLSAFKFLDPVSSML